MFRLLAFVYGIAAYIVFLVVFLWLVAFVGDFAVPKTINSGVSSNAIPAAIWDLALIALFGVPHSVMARVGFKNWITAIIPQAIERSTYMWVTNALLALLMWQWQPIGAVIWQAQGIAQIVLYSLFAFGWILLLISTFLTDHFYLFGLKQITAHLRNRASVPMQFRAILFYKLVRHPMMLGILIAIWFVPTMTVGGLVFAVGMTAYILIGIHFEERGLEAELGTEYQHYKRSTPMLVPGTGAKR